MDTYSASLHVLNYALWGLARTVGRSSESLPTLLELLSEIGLDFEETYVKDTLLPLL